MGQVSIATSPPSHTHSQTPSAAGHDGVTFLFPAHQKLKGLNNRVDERVVSMREQDDGTSGGTLVVHGEV